MLGWWCLGFLERRGTFEFELPNGVFRDFGSNRKLHNLLWIIVLLHPNLHLLFNWLCLGLLWEQDLSLRINFGSSEQRPVVFGLLCNWNVAFQCQSEEELALLLVLIRYYSVNCTSFLSCLQGYFDWILERIDGINLVLFRTNLGRNRYLRLDEALLGDCR